MCAHPTAGVSISFMVQRACMRVRVCEAAQATGHWIVDTPIANPMSVYQAYKASRRSWGINALGTIIVEVELQVRLLYGCCFPDYGCALTCMARVGTQNGMVGVGISIGGEPAAYIVETHLSRFVEGQVSRAHNTGRCMYCADGNGYWAGRQQRGADLGSNVPFKHQLCAQRASHPGTSLSCCLFASRTFSQGVW